MSITFFLRIFLAVTVNLTVNGFECHTAKASTKAENRERRYLVDPKKPYQKGITNKELKAKNSSKDLILFKDPTLEIKVAEKVSIQTKKIATPTAKLSKVSFRKVDIRGRKTQPKLEFKNDELQVPLVHEPMQTNFIDKLDEAQSLEPIGEGGW